MISTKIHGVKRVTVREGVFMDDEKRPFHTIDIEFEMEDESLPIPIYGISVWRANTASGFPKLEVIRHRAEPKDGMDHVYEAKGGE